MTDRAQRLAAGKAAFQARIKWHIKCGGVEMRCFPLDGTLVVQAKDPNGAWTREVCRGGSAQALLERCVRALAQSKDLFA